jgi:hypothetical protein
MDEGGVVARIRSLKPEHKGHRKVGRLSDRAYRLWVGLITEADDEGRFVVDPEQFRAVIFPYQRTLTVAKVEAALGELVTAELVRLYDADEHRYGLFPSWGEHQKIERARPSAHPAPLDGFLDVSAISRRDTSPDLILRDQTDRKGSNGLAPSPPSPVVFKTPPDIVAAVEKCPSFRSVSALHRPEWWQRQVRGHPGVDFARELTKAESWIAANPAKAPRRDVAGFLWRWFAKAARDVEANG